MSTFLTGFPGFLGRSLVERLLAAGRGPLTCLVQPAYLPTARETAAGIRERTGAVDGALSLVAGDITEPDLALDRPDRHADATDRLFHLAAIYDLGVDADRAHAVNVEGTRNVLAFAEACAPARVDYVSTCYVSGRHPGVFGPADFDVDQRFNNHYEASKFRAERAVRAARADGLPTTIYRPAITVGDSRSGETTKFDGPYYFLSLLRAQPRVAVVPVGLGGPHEMNLVPRDYVAGAIAHLSDRPEAVGEVFQLCDPSPPTVREVVTRFGAALDRRVVRVPIPARATRRLLERLPDVVDVEPAALDYLTHPTSYVAPNARRALADADVDLPAFGAYVDTLVAWALAHPDLSDEPMA